MKKYARKAIADENNLFKKKLPLLNQLTFELTERCNNNCVHCYINRPQTDTNAKTKELTTTNIFTILEDAAILGCKEIQFTGGEPLLRSDIPKIYTHTRRLGMIISIVTNGTLITDEISNLFKNIPFGGTLVISLYGISQDSYENITRVPGSFSSALEGINRLKERSIPFEINVPILPQNKHEIGDVENWILENFSIKNTKPRAMVLDLHTRRDTHRSKSIRKQRLTPEEQLEIRAKDEKLFKEDAMVYFAPRQKLIGSKLFACGAGIARGTVDATGKLQMCSRLRHPDTVYDLLKGSLKNAMAIFFPKIRSKVASNQQFLYRCGRCFLRGYCDNCPAASWSEFGDLDTISEYVCEIAHLEAMSLGLLKKGEKAWNIKNYQARFDMLLKTN